MPALTTLETPMKWFVLSFLTLTALACAGPSSPAAGPALALPSSTSELPPARADKAKGRKAKGGAARYDDTRPAVCDALHGDLQVACFQDAPGAVTCADYPGDLGLACEAGQFDPENGRWFAKPPAGAVP